jgi:regulator of extracellular matrix RemA (YlzA/DUF370 family)
MNAVMRSVLWAAGAGAVPFVLALIFLPGRRELALDLFLLLIAAGAVVALVRALSAVAPRAPARRLVRRERRTQRLAELDRTERAVLLSASTAFDVHYRLRPILREIAAQRLATRRGLTLDRDTAASRAVVGEDTWELVRPDREPPQLRFGPGVAAPELAKVVDALERI